MGRRGTYYTLVERDGGEHPWRIEFGDFKRATVAAEHQDRRDHGVRSADLKILTSGPQAEDQQAAVEALNARPRTLIIVTWRDEAYGSLGGISSAFRLYDTVDLSDAATKRISGKARKAGFSLHHGRCSWISYDAGAPEAFIAGLKALGYAVRSAGCRADSLAHLNTPPTPERDAGLANVAEPEG